jgi:hypothetical protein
MKHIKSLIFGLALVVATALGPARTLAQNISGGTVGGTTGIFTTSVSTPQSSGLIFTGANATTVTVANPAAPRTITVSDQGANGFINLFSAVPATVQQAPQSVYASAGYTNATTAFSNITGLSFAVAASTNYQATCYLTWNPGGATTVGPKYIWTGPASPTAVTAAGILSKTVTTNSNLSVAVASFATTLDDAVAVTASITQTDVLSLGVINGVNAGTVQLQAALHSASGTYTLANGSYCSVQ